MRRLIYTAIIGEYDTPPKLSFDAMDANCDYLCFCDADIVVPPPWQLRIIERMPMGAAATNRKVKFTIHQLVSGYDQALYIDGNIDLVRFPGDAFDILNSVSVVLLAHPLHQSVRAELVACILASKLSLRDAIEFTAAKSRTGFRDVLGMTANRVFARSLADLRVNEFFEGVLDDYLRGPRRDQLHLVPRLECLDAAFTIFPAGWAVDTFTVRPHIGSDYRRGRSVRVLRRMVVGPLLWLALSFVAQNNHREVFYGD